MSKYRNVKRGGFDSQKERRRYQELLLLQRAGKISDLERQVPFELIPAQREPDTIGPRGGRKPGKLLERAVVYVADFTYWQGGAFVVEDVKGYKRGEAYKVYAIKRKLMLYKYGIQIKEV